MNVCLTRVFFQNEGGDIEGCRGEKRVPRKWKMEERKTGGEGESLGSWVVLGFLGAFHLWAAGLSARVTYWESTTKTNNPCQC